MIIIHSKWFLKVFTWNFANAITLFPFIILKEQSMKSDRELINHEKIHIRQQLELLIVFFYVQYLFEYIYNRTIKRNSHYKAYKNISLEKEAFDNETNLNYLQEGNIYGWWKYLYN